MSEIVAVERASCVACAGEGPSVRLGFDVTLCEGCRDEAITLTGGATPAERERYEEKLDGSEERQLGLEIAIRDARRRAIVPLGDVLDFLNHTHNNGATP